MSHLQKSLAAIFFPTSAYFPGWFGDHFNRHSRAGVVVHFAWLAAGFVSCGYLLLYAIVGAGFYLLPSPTGWISLDRR